MDQIAKLCAKDEIQDCLKRYARGVDRKDWDLLRSVFHDGARDAHGEFNGNSEEFIEWVSARHATVPFSMHYLLNCLIEFTSDEDAAVETYFWAIQRRETKSDAGEVIGTDLEVFGRYIDHFAKRNGEWRIANRKVAYDSTSTSPSTNHLRKLVGVLGSRDLQDPIYEHRVAAE